MSSGVYRTPDPPIPGPKAQKARRQRRRLRRRQESRERDQVNGVTATLKLSDNVKGRTSSRAARFIRRRMDGLRAINDHRRFKVILPGQQIFGRSKKQRARVSQRGRSKA